MKIIKMTRNYENYGRCGDIRILCDKHADFIVREHAAVLLEYVGKVKGGKYEFLAKWLKKKKMRAGNS